MTKDKRTHISLRQQNVNEVEPVEYYNHPTKKGVTLKKISDFIGDSNLLFCIAFKDSKRFSSLDNDYNKNDLKPI